MLAGRLPDAAGALAASRIARRPLRSVQPAMGNHSAAKSDPAPAIRSSGRRSGGPGALAHKLAANLRARALAPVIQELRAAGFISYNAVSRGTEPTAGANPSSRQAVVSHDRQQAAGTSGKGKALIRIRSADARDSASTGGGGQGAALSDPDLDTILTLAEHVKVRPSWPNGAIKWRTVIPRAWGTECLNEQADRRLPRRCFCLDHSEAYCGWLRFPT
jgi:hypothetical protein